MNVDQKRMDILSNNLANINSTGFKKRDINFIGYRDMLVNTLNEGKFIGTLPQGLIMENISVDLNQGSLKFTENPFDFSIDGSHFFTVQDNQGNILLTKNGSFGLDYQDFLVNSDGFRVMGENGAISITDPEDFIVDDQGDIRVDGALIDRFRTQWISSREQLVVTNSSYFTFNPEAEAEGVDQGLQIKQGFLEGSNVNGIQEMTDMIAVMRSFEMSQKIIKIQDDTLSKAVNQVGKTNI
jgi:flagellar basal-body rod protein FlgG